MRERDRCALEPRYAGAYVFGRYRSRRVVRPDGTIVTKTVELRRSEWAVVIEDHHPGWAQFLANEQRLGANNTRKRQRPPGEGAALCQGIVRCEACVAGYRYHQSRCPTTHVPNLKMPPKHDLRGCQIDVQGKLQQRLRQQPRCVGEH